MTNEAMSAGERAEPANNSADWRHHARCRNDDPDSLFVQGALQRDAREVCLACPVRTECLAHALDNRIRFGVWGGMTERERRALLRRRPDVVSWAALLESARRAAQIPKTEIPSPRSPSTRSPDTPPHSTPAPRDTPAAARPRRERPAVRERDDREAG